MSESTTEAGRALLGDLMARWPERGRSGMRRAVTDALPAIEAEARATVSAQLADAYAAMEGLRTSWFLAEAALEWIAGLPTHNRQLGEPWQKVAQRAAEKATDVLLAATPASSREATE